MRLFIAISLPGSLTSRLDSILKELRTKLPPASWSRPASIHLTVAFLGDQEPEAVSRISGAVTSQIGEVRCFGARLSKFGVFPDERRARIGWIGLEPQGPTGDLAARVRESLTHHSITFDNKPFVPHLSVVRMRTPWNQADVYRFVGTPIPGNLVFEISRVVLYRSVLTPSGAIHSEEGSFALETDT